MATPYLRITDGTTHCTIITSAGAAGDYSLEQWIPAIAGLRQSDFGNGPYEEVTEEMRLVIRDTTPSGVYDKLQTLNILLEQAERFVNGEDVTKVEIHYAPSGSTISSDSAPLKAIILGRASGNETSGAGLVEEQTKTGFTLMLPITLRFWRRGAWYLSTTAQSGSATTNGDEATVTLLGTLTTPAPAKVSFTNGYFFTACADGFLLCHDDSDGITIVNAEDLASGTFTSITDATDCPRNTNILRFTPGVTTPVKSGDVAFTTSGRKLLVYANIRNNSTTTSFIVRASLKATRYVYTAYYSIPANATPFAAWYCLGPVSCPAVPTAIGLEITASAASGTLDIDTLVTLDTEDPAHAAIQLGWDDNVNTITTESTITVTVDPGYIDALTPTVSGSGFLFRKTDVAWWSKASTVRVCWLKTGDGADVTDWRTNIAGTAHTNTFTVTRTSVYLSPV